MPRSPGRDVGTFAALSPTAMRARLPLSLALLTLAACSGETPVAVGPSPEPEPSPVRYVSEPIPPLYPAPSPQQLEYQRMETNVFIHFGTNTFTGVEWGDGTADPDVFQPTEFDPTQWLRIFDDVGFKGLTLVTKHIDGFLLWPSRHSDYSVASSSWRGGQGDVVKEVADATRAAGLELGLYLAPWDRNHPAWGTPSYNGYFVGTLWELIVPSYYEDLGQLYQIWFDYGHDFNVVTEAQLDAYDHDWWVREVRHNQPGALVTPETDVFFPGNEAGVAPEPNWSVRDDFFKWAPYECDVTLRGERSWYWRANDAPKPLADLVDIYFTSVGRGCTMLLAVGPDDRGLVAPDDEARLYEWRAAIDAIFADNLALHATASASAVRPGSEGWSAAAAVDTNPDSFWSTNEPTGWVEVELDAARTVNVLELMEPIKYGQRVASFRLDAWDGSGWVEAVRGTTVGYKRLLRFPPVTARRWRVVVEDARAAPALSQIGLYSALGWQDEWAGVAP